MHEFSEGARLESLWFHKRVTIVKSWILLVRLCCLGEDKCMCIYIRERIKRNNGVAVIIIIIMVSGHVAVTHRVRSW